VAPVTPVPAGSEPVTEQSDAVAYWKGIAEQHRAKAQAYSEYEVLIDHMNNNPEHVSAFQRIITDGAENIAVAEGMARASAPKPQAQSDEEVMLAELGLGGHETTRSTPPAARPQGQLTVEEAKKLGAMQERVRLELAQFKNDVLQVGIGEHIVDEFLEYLRNPNGMTYHDLFAGWRAGKARMTGKDPLAGVAPGGSPASGEPKPGVMPSTVGALSGSVSNRPNAGVYPARTGGDRYVPDPANI